jgi:CRISPR-associated protein Cas1
MTQIMEKPTFFAVEKKNHSFKVSGKSLLIVDKDKKETISNLPILGVRDIVFLGKFDIDSKLFDIAEKRKLPIHFLSKGGKYKASVFYDYPKNVFLRFAQYENFRNLEKRLFLAKKYIETKLRNQDINLQKNRSKKRLKSDFKAVENIDQLRGKEGAAAKSYFDILKKEKIIKDPDFKFTGRYKRPPLDEVNSILSFAYSLLYTEIHSQLLIASLDPYIGFLHDQQYSHPALASDFLEIYRGIVDNFAIKLFNRKEILKEDFKTEKSGAVMLERSGYNKFFPKWIRFLRKEGIKNDLNLTQIIEKDVRHLAHFLMGDIEDIKFFHWQR